MRRYRARDCSLRNTASWCACTTLGISSFWSQWFALSRRFSALRSVWFGALARSKRLIWVISFDRDRRSHGQSWFVGAFTVWMIHSLASSEGLGAYSPFGPAWFRPSKTFLSRSGPHKVLTIRLLWRIMERKLRIILDIARPTWWRKVVIWHRVLAHFTVRPVGLWFSKLLLALSSHTLFSTVRLNCIMFFLFPLFDMQIGILCSYLIFSFSKFLGRVHILCLSL